MASYEIIEAFNSRGMGLNRPILKDIAHKKGIPHATIHLWIVCKEGIIIQQRSKNKDTYPLLWDVSVAGHINYKEDPTAAAKREAKEELGIDIAIDKLMELGRVYEVHYHKKTKVMDREFKTIFAYNFSGSIKEVKIQKEEVEAVRSIDLTHLKTSLKSNSPNHMVPHKESYYNIICKGLTKSKIY